MLLFTAAKAQTNHKTSDSNHKTSFEERIHELGLDEIINDFSDIPMVIVDEPECAYINITGTDKMPAVKGQPVNVCMEVYLGHGNYFRKKAIIDVQGNTSTYFEKKNFKADFCDDEWIGEDTPDIAIGDWVKQDSYHFKAYYIDWLRGVGVCGYRLYDQMALSIGRPWTRVEKNISKPKENARCYPDGFPCVVYLNGDFYGIFAWQLKKHRDNMNQTKTVAEHIHLDGELSDNSFWHTDSIQWEKFEVRNPKNLYTMDGRVYDGDNPSELMDETSVYYTSADDDAKTKLNKEHTAKVKKYILNLASLYSQMEKMDSEEAGTDTLRAFFEKHFDIKSLVDYACLHYAINNYDGFTKNWQWFTYDGNKWFVTPYDLDCVMGNYHTGTVTIPASQNSIGELYSTFRQYGPFYWMNKLYKNDIRERYCELRDLGIYSVKNINALLEDWYWRVGNDNYTYEWIKWPDSKCISEVIANEGWKQVENVYYWEADVYDKEKTYNPGDRCQFESYVWEATEIVCGVKPYIKIGYTDSLERYKNWIKLRIRLLDEYFKYAPEKNCDVNGDGTVDVADIASVIDAMASTTTPGASVSGKADVNGDGTVDVADIAAIIDEMAADARGIKQED